jgi:hypothetical protein
MTERTKTLLLGGIQFVLALALIAGGIAYGYENFQGDQCGRTFSALAATNQAGISDVRARLDAVRKREAALQTRRSELEKK